MIEWGNPQPITRENVQQLIDAIDKHPIGPQLYYVTESHIENLRNYFKEKNETN